MLSLPAGVALLLTVECSFTGEKGSSHDRVQIEEAHDG
jgi:hypothetical protein